MSGYFQSVGRALLANGYLIVPIKPGAKSPALSGWQKARMTAADLSRHAECGVGVLTGQGAHPIAGIDLDISHPLIVQRVIDWCREHLGSSCERVGAAPRVLLAYRAEQAAWTKGSSIAFFDPTDPEKANGKRNEQRIEVLGLGQQFVAYHVHPDTGRDYEWTDLLGGLEHTKASELPVITDAQISALFDYVHRLVRDTPGLEIINSASTDVGSANGDDLLALSPRVGLTIEQSKEYLRYVENSQGVDYDTWLRVGMALQHEHGDEALDVWLGWSRQSEKFDEKDARRRWASFGRQSSSPTTMRWLIKIANQSKADQEVEQQRVVLDQIKALLAEAQDTPSLTSGTAKRIREMLPENSTVRAEVFGLFQGRFKAISGTRLPIAEVRALLAPENRVPTVRKKYPLTEFGNADRMLDKYGQGLMFVPETKHWYVWTGIYWRMASDAEIEHIAKETIRALVNEYDDYEQEAAAFFDFCRVSQQAKMVKNMVTLASSDPRVLVPADELDKTKGLLGVQNGVVDLRTGTLLPPDPNLRITKVCQCDYNPRAAAPLWSSTLLEVFSGDEDMVAYFQRVIGYTAIGDPVEDFMVIPYGNGANGKSTVFGTIRKAFGAYARSAEASTFVSDARGGAGGAGGAREDLLRLRGTRFCYVNEPDENSELREGSVKSMTGGDAIPARGLYSRSSVEIQPTWVVFMPTNHKPIIKGGDYGIWRRLVLLPFERNFETDRSTTKDEKREEKLAAEAEGVLAWIVQGALAYQQDGLAPPLKIKMAKESYRSQMDLLAEWIEQCCEVGPEHMETLEALWKSWEAFARERGILNYVRSSIALGRRLEQRFPCARNMKNRLRIGIRVARVGHVDDFFKI